VEFIMRGKAVRGVRGFTLVAALIAGSIGSHALAGAAEDRLLAGERLLENGRAVEARFELLAARKTATDEQTRSRAVELLAVADRRLRAMGEVELSLQKAELALAQGELRLAETHANAAKRSEKAAEADVARANELIAKAETTRADLAPMVGSILAQAEQDFLNERYADAKAGLGSIVRTGVPLSQTEMATINRYQDRIYELERQRGSVFEVEYVPLAVMSGNAPAQALESVAAVATTLLDESEQPAGDGWQGGSGDPLQDAAAIDAQRVLNEAAVAFDAERWNEAVEKYTLVTTTYARYLTSGEVGDARQALETAKSMLGVASGGGSLEQEINQRQVMREEASAVFNNLMTQARDAKNRGDIQTARNRAAEARLKWNEAYANGLFSEDQYRQKVAEIDQLIRDIDATAETLTRSEIDQREKELAAEEARTRAQQESEREARINENLQRLRQLQAEQKYEEALQVVEQVLFLDPLNPAALLLKEVLRDVVIYRDFDRARRERGLSYARETLQLEQSMIVPETLMAYPPDWPELSFRRGEVQSFVESEADRRVLASLETRRIPASFADNSLQDVLAFVATVTNINLDVDWESLEQIGIERDKLISLELREVPARVVLDRVLEKAQPDAFSKAGWAVNDGVLVVAADEALRRNTFIVIYDIRDLLFQIPNFDNAPQLDLDQVLNQGQRGGGGGGGSIFEDEDDNNAAGPTEEELTQQILEIIQTNVDFEGWRDNGGSTGVVQVLNGNLIITNTARNHRQIQGLLNQLREIRSVQINVESRFLTVAQDFFEQIGFDLDIYFNAQNEQFSAVERQLRAFGQGSLANEGLSVVPSDIIGGVRNANNTGYTFTGLDANGVPQYAFQQQPFSVPAPASTSVIPVQQNSLGIVDALLEGGGTAFSQAITAVNPALAIAGTFLDDVQVDFLIEATQSDQRTVGLSAPRLTFSNGRSANIAVVNQIGFVSDLTPIVGTSSVAFDPTIGRLNSGFSLAVRGVASADRRYVTLTVQAGVSGRPTFTTQSVTAVAGGTGGTDGGGTVSSNFQVPQIDVTQVNTGVTVPDKGTLLIGGQRLTNEIEIETGVPVLSKMPIINRFFTNRSEVREERTLMILIKPTIIIQNEEEERNFPGLLDQIRNPFR